MIKYAILATILLSVFTLVAYLLTKKKYHKSSKDGKVYHWQYRDTLPSPEPIYIKDPCRHRNILARMDTHYEQRWYIKSIHSECEDCSLHGASHYKQLFATWDIRIPVSTNAYWGDDHYTVQYPVPEATRQP